MKDSGRCFHTIFITLTLLFAATLGAVTRPASYNLIRRSNYKDHYAEEIIRQASNVTTTPSADDGDDDECSCDSGERVRKEVGSMTSAEWTSYARAFRALKDTSDGQSTFENFVRTHSQQVGEGHGSSQFGPWHRGKNCSICHSQRDPCVNTF